MRILIISIYYKPEPVPKPHELAEGLAKRGHSVTVLTGFPSYPTGRLYPGYRIRHWQVDTIEGVRVVRLPLYANHSSISLLRVAHIVTFFLSTLLMGPFLCGATDIVYVWGNPPTSGLAGWIIARFQHARFVYGVHDLWPELAVESFMVSNAFVVKILDALERFVLNCADLVLPISQGFKRKILEKGVAADKVHVLPHWADETLYKPLPSDPCLAAKIGVSDCFVILYAGNIGRLQGLDNLIEAAGMLQEEISSLRVVLVGDGVERNRLQSLVAKRRIKNVVFIERQSPQEIVAYSALASALYVGLVDSQLASLSVPSKVPTYMACGRPILSAVPGETVMLIERGQCGVNCENTSQGIAEGIRRMVALSVQERLLMGQRAQEIFAREFAMSSLLKQHETLMQHTVDHVFEVT